MKSEEHFENDIRSLKSELEKIRHVQRDWVNLAAHDLYAPIRKLESFTDLLIGTIPAEMDFQTLRYKTKMQHCISQIKDFLDDLTTLSGFYIQPPNYQPCNLFTLVNSLIHQQEAHPAHIFSISALPTIEADAQQMEKLFSELINNSFTYTKESLKKEISVSSATLSSGEVESLNLVKERIYYKIIVADQGSGFNAEYAEKIFLPFTKLHGRSVNPGNGFGLAFSKSIVENHHGMIYASSGEDKTEMIIILPEKQTGICYMET